MRKALYIKRKRVFRLYPVAVFILLIFIYSNFSGLNSAITRLFGILSLLSVFGSLWQEFSLKLDRIEYPECDICGSDNSKILFLKDNLEMVECLNCGQVYAKPRYAGFRRGFFLQYFSLLDIFDKKRRIALRSQSNKDENIKPKINLLMRFGFPEQGDKLLDIGCGSGLFLEVARESGFEVEGVEPGWFSGLYAKLKHNLKVHIKTAVNVTLSCKFDVITCLHVIEHIPAPLGFMEEIRGLKKSGGIALIATPNFGCEEAQELQDKWDAAGPSDHIFLFDINTLKNLALKAGFEVLDIQVSGKKDEELIMICQ